MSRRWGVVDGVHEVAGLEREKVHLEVGYWRGAQKRKTRRDLRQAMVGKTEVYVEELIYSAYCSQKGDLDTKWFGW